MTLLGIVLDPSAATPLFRQLADQLMSRIENGTFPAGYRLPPTRQLAESVGAHRNTVVRAYDELSAAGAVESVVGRGTFVAAHDPDLALVDQIGTPEKDLLIPLVWDGVLSRAARVEALGRVERLPQASRRRGVRDAVDLARMHPAPELMPTREFRLCIDHVLRTRGGKALRYAPAQGLPELRELLVEDLARMGVPARADDIVVTTGSQQALDLIARTLIDSGDGFAVEAETYFGAIKLLAVAGARLVSVPADAEGPSIDALDAQAGGCKGLYLMPNSRNPTGATISAKRRVELVAWSHRHGVPIVEDDYDADLNLTDTPPPPAMKALDSDVIYLSTFSKRLIPALRVGFVVCPPALRSVLVQIKNTVDLSNSALLQYALAEFLERGYLRRHLRRTLPIYRSRRDAIEAAFAAHLPGDVQWAPMLRGLVTWLELPPALPADQVFVEAQRQGVLVTPGSLNSANGRVQYGLRLTICNEPEERIDEGIARLARAMSAVRKSHRSRPERPAVGVI